VVRVRGGEPERFLGLRAPIDIRGGRPFHTARPRPRLYSDTLWGFLLEELPGKRKRLVVSGYAARSPRPLVALGNVLFWEPAHWIMQGRQFANLKRRAEKLPAGAHQRRRALVDVWLVVASKYGSTREVADTMAEELRRAAEVEVPDAADMSDFEGADAVVLGSAIYAVHWLEPARRLVQEQAEQLAARPTWLFSVGPISRSIRADTR
jgi:hypothetical protein